MENLAVLPRLREHDGPIRLLLADDDPPLRSLLVSRAHDTIEAIAVLEAGDGAEAVQLGLQRRPQIALLDVNMPLVGGIEAAVTLRELQPQMRLALHTADPLAHRERARERRLLLFDKLELDQVIGWLETQVRDCLQLPVGPRRQARTKREERDDDGIRAA